MSLPITNLMFYSHPQLWYIESLIRKNNELTISEKSTLINPMIVFIMFYKNFVFVKGTRKNTKCRSFVSGSGSTNMLQTAHICKKLLDLVYHILDKK